LHWCPSRTCWTTTRTATWRGMPGARATKTSSSSRARPCRRRAPRAAAPGRRARPPRPAAAPAAAPRGRSRIAAGRMAGAGRAADAGVRCGSTGVSWLPVSERAKVSGASGAAASQGALPSARARLAPQLDANSDAVSAIEMHARLTRARRGRTGRRAAEQLRPQVGRGAAGRLRLCARPSQPRRFLPHRAAARRWRRGRVPRTRRASWPHAVGWLCALGRSPARSTCVSSAPVAATLQATGCAVA